MRLGPGPTAGMAALLILLSVVAVSILVTRIATRALMLTGLSRETARFQARSIITGTGFTTDEAEHVVNHPVRRRITLTLMLVGNAVLVTALSTFVLSFTSTGTPAEVLQRGLVLAAGLGVLAYLALSDRVDRCLSLLIEWVLDRAVGFQGRGAHRANHRAAGRHDRLRAGGRRLHFGRRRDHHIWPRGPNRAALCPAPVRV
ncbi:hypothetical protein [Salinibacter altiplanensis]|uniref:hypothetical protein n=1 Tax=Salinibacter altiplanensis TaxID=1803181 RepID=UPI000C9FF84A|nr:hypothetical protein [Salinibacter altiplanensis]